jgi:LDH2 family malate/lactate/ureidoglycolate dehydrogenase
MLSTLLSGAAYGTDSGNMIEGARSGVDGQFFIAIDVAAFLDPATFRQRVDAVVGQVHASRRRPDVDRLYVPGEIETEIARDYAANGIRLSGPTIDDIATVATRLGVDASVILL